MNFFKLLIILCLTVLSLADTTNVLFEMNLENGLKGFSELKASNTAQVSKESDVDIITFSGLSRYGGMLTKMWLESPTGWYYVTLKFKGIQGKRTGAFLGYISKDNDSIIHSIGMDQDQYMDNYQIFVFKNVDSEWHSYEAYLKGGTGIKLLLEKGNYFGLTENLQAAFKDLDVKVANFNETCPGNDGSKKSSYFAQIFNSSNFEGKINQEIKLSDDSKKVILKIKFPITNIPCIKTQLYGLDSNGSVIEAIVPTQVLQVENKETNLLYIYEFTVLQLESFGCWKSTTECNANECIRYQCDFQIHFYLDPAITFTTKQAEFNYSKANSAAMFKSLFLVQVQNTVSKELFNSMIQAPSVEKPCADRCNLNTETVLELYIKNALGQWLPKSKQTVVWGDFITFKIISTPSNYQLNIIDIYSITNESAISLGKNIVKNFYNGVNGEMTFDLPINAESGLTKEQHEFNFYFLISLTEITSRRRRSLSAAFSSSVLPEAALRKDDSVFQFGDCSSSSSCFSSSCATADICICKDTTSCAILDKCDLSNCTCSKIQDTAARCELIECVKNYGCENCFCGLPSSDSSINTNSGSNTDGTQSKIAFKILVSSIFALLALLFI